VSPKLRRRIIGAAVVAGLVSLITLVRVATRELPRVDYVRVTRGPVRELVAAVTQGTVMADHHVTVPIHVSSAVIELPKAEGSTVAKGELIAAFDDRDAALVVAAQRAARDAARAQAKLAKTQQENARRELGRSESLANQGAVAGAQLDRARDALAAAGEQGALADANERSAQAALGQAELQLTRHRIFSPMDGVLVRLDLEIGELPPGSIGGGATALPGRAALPGMAGDAGGAIQVLDPAQLYVEAQVDERDVARLREGQRVELTFDALGNERLGGRLTYVRPLVEVMADRSRQITVRIVPDPALLPRLRAGMGADTEIVVAEQENALRLPPQLVLQNQGTYEVFVYDDGEAQRREVTPGLSSWDATEIAAGLAEGDRVLWPPETLELDDGAAIELAQDRTPEANGRGQAGRAAAQP
jgi:multidrug efflux pump subunit AcrA (membrane-fusion protein)